MNSAGTAKHRPAWYLIPVRILLITIMLTLLSFAVGLFLGIAGTILASAWRGVHPNMVFAYRHIALPVATIAAACTLIGAAWIEVQYYRRARLLHLIEEQLGPAN